MAVLLDALRLLVPQRPDLRLLVVGRGDPDALRRDAGPGLADRLDILGGVDDVTKAAALRSMDVYCAPNTGGESFGMVLTEAMAAGAAVLASDLGAFRAVLQLDGGSDGGRPGTEAGVLFPTGDARGLASALAALLDDPQRRVALGRRRPGPRRRLRLAGGRGGRAARLPGRHRGRSPPGARPDRREHPVTAPTLGVLVPDLTPTAWAVVVVALLLLAVVTWICVVRARRLDRLHRRTDAARAGLADALDRRGAAALRVADALAAAPRPGGEVPTLPLPPRHRPAARSHPARGRRGGTGRRSPRLPRRVPGGPAGGREPVSTAARWRRTRSPAGSPASTATRCPPGSPPSSRTSSSPS